MSVMQFIIGCLATFRLTCFISRDYGPFGIFSALRKWDRGSKLLKCTFCTSTWLAMFVSLGFYFSGVNVTWMEWICYTLSFSTITIIIDRTWVSDYISN